MWTTIADILLISSSCLLLWHIVGLSASIRGAASKLTGRRVTRVAFLDDGAAVGLAASLIYALCRGDLSTLTIGVSVLGATINRIFIKRLTK